MKRGAGVGTLAAALLACSSPAEDGPPARPFLEGGARDAGAETSVPDATSCPLVRLYPDSDGDGFGSALRPAVEVCEGTPGYVANNKDCADEDERARPGQRTPQDSAHPVRGPVNSPPPQDRIDQLDFDCDKRVVCFDAAAGGSPCDPYGRTACFCL